MCLNTVYVNGMYSFYIPWYKWLPEVGEFMYTVNTCVLLLVHTNHCNHNVQNEYHLIYGLAPASLTVENIQRSCCNDRRTSRGLVVMTGQDRTSL